MQHFEVAQTLIFFCGSKFREERIPAMNSSKKICWRTNHLIQDVRYFFFLPFLPNPFSVLVEAFVIAIAQLDATSSA